MDHEPASYLRNLAERLRQIPVVYGTDDHDIFQLHQSAEFLEELRATCAALQNELYAVKAERDKARAQLRDMLVRLHGNRGDAIDDINLD